MLQNIVKGRWGFRGGNIKQYHIKNTSKVQTFTHTTSRPFISTPNISFYYTPKFSFKTTAITLTYDTHAPVNDEESAEIEKINKEEIEQEFSEAFSELRTIRDILRFCVSKLEEYDVKLGQTSKSSYEESLFLLFHTLNLGNYLPHCDNHHLFPINELMDCKLTKREKIVIFHHLKRRIIERIPVGYLTNSATLSNYHFYVDERVLIPRSYIADILLSDELQPSWRTLLFPQTTINNDNNNENNNNNVSVIEVDDINKQYQVRSCLDMCTGSGCLAIIAAEVFPNANVVGVDASPEALAVAKINIEEKYPHLEERVSFIQSNMFSKLDPYLYTNFFDIIISNPPYVPKERMELLPEEYKKEPTMALYGGDDGLEFVKILAKESLKYLREGGVLMIEAAGFSKQQIAAFFPNLRIRWVSTPSFAQVYSPNESCVFIIPYAELLSLSHSPAHSSPSSPSAQSPAAAGGNANAHSSPPPVNANKTVENEDWRNATFFSG